MTAPSKTSNRRLKLALIAQAAQYIAAGQTSFLANEAFKNLIGKEEMIVSRVQRTQLNHHPGFAKKYRAGQKVPHCSKALSSSSPAEILPCV